MASSTTNKKMDSNPNLNMVLEDNEVGHGHDLSWEGIKKRAQEIARGEGEGDTYAALVAFALVITFSLLVVCLGKHS